MCTVVLRHVPGEALQALALRDELVGRDFDDPGAWWPDHPTAVGGRDRSAGGSWCVSDIPSGRTAFVLNRPDKRQADTGAPSRGVLPLLAARYGEGWREHVELAGMASFALVLASPVALTCWAFDGASLSLEPLPEGTSMVTSGGAEDGKATRYLRGFQGGSFPDDWLALLREQRPVDDPASLVVRGRHEDKVFATVFGQLLRCAPGELWLSWTRQPWADGVWTTRTWT